MGSWPSNHQGVSRTIRRLTRRGRFEERESDLPHPPSMPSVVIHFRRLPEGQPAKEYVDGFIGQANQPGRLPNNSRRAASLRRGRFETCPPSSADMLHVIYNSESLEESRGRPSPPPHRSLPTQARTPYPIVFLPIECNIGPITFYPSHTSPTPAKIRAPRVKAPFTLNRNRTFQFLLSDGSISTRGDMAN